MFHYFPTVIEYHTSQNATSDKAIAFLAIKPSRVAIIFVHGFGGHIVTTWGDVHETLLSSDRCRGVDIFFFGYDSRRVRAELSAAKLLAFISKIAGDNKNVILNSLGTQSARGEDFVYDNIFIVAHSLGGAISRRVALDWLDIREDWAKTLHLILFAPAHKGANILALCSAALSNIPLGSIAVNLAAHFFPALQDLAPGSQFLVDIEAQTKRQLSGVAAITDTRKSALIARTVIFGDHEKIVDTNRFAGDGAPKVYIGRDHITVCKTSDNFVEPANDIVGYI